MSSPWRLPAHRRVRPVACSLRQRQGLHPGAGCDGGEFPHPVHAEVRYREGPALVLLGSELGHVGAPGSEFLHLGGDLRKALVLGVSDDRGDQSTVDGHRDRDVDRTVDADRVLAQEAFASGTWPSARAAARITMSLTEIRAVSSRRALRVRANLQQGIELAIHRQVEMRCGLFRFGKPGAQSPCAWWNSVDPRTAPLQVAQGERRPRAGAGATGTRRCRSVGACGDDSLDVDLDDPAFGPVPLSAVRSRPAWWAMRRASGLAKTRPPSGPAPRARLPPASGRQAVARWTAAVRTAADRRRPRRAPRPLSFLEQQRDQGIHGHASVPAATQMRHGTVVDRLDFHGCLVGPIPPSLRPPGPDRRADGARQRSCLGHGRGERGHEDLDRHGSFSQDL